MQYQSIIRFFDYSGIEYNNTEVFNLSRAKKLVTAEFAMQEDGIIVIDGFSYTKQDILSELEFPDFSKRIQFHQIVWQHKGLLNLLEQDAFDFQDGSTWFALHRTSGFTAFFSPYFAEVYNRIMRLFLNDNDLSSAAVWLDYCCFIESEDEEKAFRNTRLYLHDIIRFFKNLNDTTYKSRDEELHMWYSTSWSPFINKLPDSLLSNVDDIVSAIINFTVRIQKSGRKVCYKISNELLKVTNANFTLLQLIRSNHVAYKQNYESKTIAGWLRGKVNIYYIIIVVAFGVLRLVMPESKEDRIASGLEFKNMVYSDVNTYLDARQSYRENRGRYENVFYMAQQNRSDPFDAKEVYLLVEAVKDSSKALSPFTIRNNTADTVLIHVMRGNAVYHFEISPQQFYSFAPALHQSVDMFLELDYSKNPSRIPYFPGKDMQALHIGPQDMEHDTAYAFQDEINTEMPYFDEAALSKKVPLVIELQKRKNKFYFFLKGRGNIVYQNGMVKPATMN